jgi:hypothetical protein
MPILTNTPAAAIAKIHGLGGSAVNQYEIVMAENPTTIAR